MALDKSPAAALMRRDYPPFGGFIAFQDMT